MVTVPKKSSGFTIIELLVVVALIGLIASVVIVTIDQARAKARDTKRKADLAQIQVALELYRNEHGTFQVLGSGNLGGGMGRLSFENGAQYSTAVTRVLYNEGFLATPIIPDPLETDSSIVGYMIFVCNNGQAYALSATLENPTSDEQAEAAASCFSSISVDTFGKNYVRKNE